ncbi:(Fe-S)-binding protein [Candidatus Pacearchaeota archaeon]|nr:(Fe-S)-binding protein [Candidatus Pacearchaeota archaeon]
MPILNIFKGKGNVLYYPGCLTKHMLSAELENYKKILNRLKIDFIMLPQEMCCGSPARNAGYETDARKLARKNLELFKQHSVSRIITNCPACFKVFSQDYKEMLPDWGIKAEHIVFTILNALEKGQKAIVKKSSEKATYHDPCHLGRHCGIYEEPRLILELLGYEIVEMKNNKENAFCCGGGAGLKANNPELAAKVAKRIIKQAKDAGVSKIITTCPLCFAHLTENSDIGIEITEFSYAVADALGLKAERVVIGAER